MFIYLLFLIVFAVGTALERRTLKYTEAEKLLATLACCRFILCCDDVDVICPFAEVSQKRLSSTRISFTKNPDVI